MASLAAFLRPPRWVPALLLAGPLAADLRGETTSPLYAPPRRWRFPETGFPFSTASSYTSPLRFPRQLSGCLFGAWRFPGGGAPPWRWLQMRLSCSYRGLSPPPCRGRTVGRPLELEPPPPTLPWRPCGYLRGPSGISATRRVCGGHAAPCPSSLTGQAASPPQSPQLL